MVGSVGSCEGRERGLGHGPMWNIRPVVIALESCEKIIRFALAGRAGARMYYGNAFIGLFYCAVKNTCTFSMEINCFSVMVKKAFLEHRHKGIPAAEQLFGPEPGPHESTPNTCFVCDFGNFEAITTSPKTKIVKAITVV